MADTGTTAPTRSIALPDELVRGLERRIQGSSFPSVDAFVAFVLARLLERPGDVGFTEEDERALRERLRSLGYID
jgi:Arc/MetJ-type ribon-helix-helix transcriptional regulator